MRDRAGLDRTTIARAALRIVDRDGPAAVSMRRLARELDVSAMAPYNHLAGKQAVLDAVAEHVLAEVAEPDPGLPWRDRIEAIFVGLRAAYRRHPRAMPLVQTASAATPTALRPMEAVLAALADGGFAPAGALATWSVLIGLTNGHVAYELHGHLRGSDDRARGIDAERFPHITQALGAGIDWDDAFVQGLRGAIATAAAGARRPPPHGGPSTVDR